MARFPALAMALACTAALLGAPPITLQAAVTRASLNIPKQVDGHRANVGLLILGHSTSDQGDYPQKLAAALKRRSRPTAATTRCSR
jgi:hypothetical protein